MKPISQFEPSKPVSRTMTQLTALVAELRKEVCNLETSIDRAPSVRSRIFHAPRPIVAHLRARRDNLLLTISTLENQLNDPISLQGAITVSATRRPFRAARRSRRPSANVEWLRSTEACCP